MRKIVAVVLSASLAVGCGGPSGEFDMNVGFTGLWTSPSDLNAPPGALAVADNMVMLRPGIGEVRRGFSRFEASPSITGPINALTVFNGAVIAHHNVTSISRWTGSAWSAYSGTFTPLSGKKPVFYQSAGSLFVTTTSGEWELASPTGTWRLTGAPSGLDATASLNRTSGAAGWSTANAQWAYRTTWLYRNANDRLEEGPPSGRQVVVNPAAVVVAIGSLVRAGTTVTATVGSHPYVVGDVLDMTPGEANFPAGQKTVTGITATTFTYTEAGAAVASTVAQTFSFNGRNVTITVPIPAVIADHTGWVARIFRSAASASATSPPDDLSMGLVAEVQPTNLDISTGSMSVVDFAPDDVRGETLYTSLGNYPNDVPPVCADMVEWRNSTFCLNVSTNQRLELQLLAVGGTTGLRVGDYIELRSVATPTSLGYYVSGALVGATAENIAAGHFLVSTLGSAAQNIQNTAASIVRVLNGWSATRTMFRAFYASAPTEFPGRIIFETVAPESGQFAATLGVTSVTSPPMSYFAPNVPYTVAITAGGLVRVGSTVTVTCETNHGLVVGQTVALEAVMLDAHFPEGPKTVASVTSPTVFTYTESGMATTATEDYSIHSAPLSTMASTNDARTAGIAFSLQDEPWAMPQINRIFAGSGTAMAFTKAGERLFVWTDSGLFELLGFYPGFFAREVDPTVRLLGPRMATTLGQRAAAYTNKGAVMIADTPVEVGVPIKRTLQEHQANATDAVVSAKGFLLGLTGDNLTALFLPPAAPVSPDPGASMAYIYSEPADGWTRWTAGATCGFYDRPTDTLYLGRYDGGVWQQRKTYTIADYQDPGATGIDTVVEWVAQAEPLDKQKQWTHGFLDFGDARFTTGAMAFATDLSPTLSADMAVAPPQGSTAEKTRVPFWVPTEKNLGNRLRVRFSTPNTANQFYALQGLGLTGKAVSSDAGR